MKPKRRMSCRLLGMAAVVSLVFPMYSTAADEKGFSYDDQVVTKLSLDELSTIVTDAGFTEIEVLQQPSPTGIDGVISAHAGEHRFIVFLQQQGTSITAGFVVPEHHATLDKINQLYQSGFVHGVSAQIDREGRAKLERRIDCQYGVTKRTIRKQLHHFDADIKLFYGMVCK